MTYVNIRTSTGPTVGWQNGYCAPERVGGAGGRGRQLTTDDILGERFLDRFWVFVRKTPTCWLWTAGCDAYGYGQISRPKKSPIKAHRAAWMLAHGPITSQQFVLHKCDTRHCVRESHLFLGTQSDNMKDAASKGRLHRARPGARTLSAEQEREIIAIYDALPKKKAPVGLVDELAQRFGINPKYVSLIGRRTIVRPVVWGL